MKALSSALIRLAAYGAQDARWGQAMLAEFHVAADDGRGMSFAFGCLWGTLIALPFHPNGRFLLGKLALLGVVASMMAFELSSAWRGAYLLLSGRDHYYAHLIAADDAQSAQADTYLIAAPFFTTVLAMLGACHLRLTWLVSRHAWLAARRTMACIACGGLLMATVMVALTPGATGVVLYMVTAAFEWLLLAMLAARHPYFGKTSIQL
jgi:hypothetical protein